VVLAIAIANGDALTRVARATEAGAIEDETSHTGAPFQGSPRPSPSQGFARRWYGWQILLADAASAACVVGLKSGACLAPYVLAGPAIHVGHARYGMAGASLGLRLLLPAVGAGIGAAAAGCPSPAARMQTPGGDASMGDSFTVGIAPDVLCGIGDAALGAAIGMILAAGLDATLGFTSVTTPHEGATVSSAPRHLGTLVPQVSVGSDVVALGLRGAF